MKLPPITIAKADRDRLVSIATVALGSGRVTPAASMLLSEVGRATIVVQESLPPQVVAVHSEVEIRDNITNTNRRLRLVYPEDAALDSNMVSVLTPLGAALVGLSVGDTIDWCTATGDQSSVTVLRTGMNLDRCRKLASGTVDDIERHQIMEELVSEMNSFKREARMVAVDRPRPFGDSIGSRPDD